MILTGVFSTKNIDTILTNVCEGVSFLNTTDNEIYKVGNKILEYAMEEKKKRCFFFFHCVTLPINKYAFHLLKTVINM